MKYISIACLGLSLLTSVALAQDCSESAIRQTSRAGSEGARPRVELCKTLYAKSISAGLTDEGEKNELNSCISEYFEDLISTPDNFLVHQPRELSANELEFLERALGVEGAGEVKG